ncbi:molybdate ABC transporter substrate-binding protein [Nocardioides vastitatis]|uniref:Molybdate ABC transporter substrate-binding protein n=1 Tax=Nocardioides vastitatis TaxID=2568655 RepID=A0ABW0ZD48_9ACTN
MRSFLVALLLLPLSLPACGDADDQTLTVFAAASLTPVFDVLEENYEDDHPGVDVRISYGGSADLVTQIEEGAEVDVFASADTPTMDRLVEAGLARSEPRDFASNTLAVAVAPGNPLHIATLDDLADPGLDLVLCAPEVPCGRAAHQVADRAGVTLQPVSEEQSVTDVLAKVREGEADAGLVYATDVEAADRAVSAVGLPELAGVVNHYPISVIEGSDDPALAQDLVDLVLSDAGQAVLADHGFGPRVP